MLFHITNNIFSMDTIKTKYPKDFEKFSEHCQTLYIHNIMKYGIVMEVEPLFFKLSERAQVAYISEIMTPKKNLLLEINDNFYRLFKSEFTIKNGLERFIFNFNKCYWKMNNQHKILDFYLDFTKKTNINIIYDTINTFIDIYNLYSKKNILLPFELWYIIFEYMNYYSILKFRLQLKNEIFCSLPIPS